MKMNSFFAIMVGLVLSSVVFAQGVAGKWVGETQGRGGPQMVTLELKVDGDKLTGTYQQGQQPAGEIAEGKVVDASTITFKRSVAGRGGGDPVTIEYTGKVSGAEMTLTPMAPAGGRGGGGPIMLKRS